MQFFQTLYARAETLLGERLFRLFRYITAGGTAAASNILFLFLLVHFVAIHYLPASIIAYLMAVAVSFTLQKFWTFQDRPTHDIHAQFFRYSLVVLANLGLNTILMYTLVTHFNVWYLLAQICTTATVAITGYFGYKHFVFAERNTQ